MKNERNSGAQRPERGEDIIAGRNAVAEALRAGRNIDSILVARGERSGSVAAIAGKARQKNIPVKEADPRKLDFLCGGAAHQGIVAVAAVVETVELEDLFRRAEEKGEAPFFVIADEVEDPHNLGALIRSAEAAGAHGMIIPKRRAAGLTYAVGWIIVGILQPDSISRCSQPMRASLFPKAG